GRGAARAPYRSSRERAGQEAGPPALPADAALFGRVDLLRLPRLEQEGFHVAHQELLRRLVAHVQAVMVDERRLELQPLIPAGAADRLVHPRAQFVAQWRLRQLLIGTPAADALYLRHSDSFTIE